MPKLLKEKLQLYSCRLKAITATWSSEEPLDDSGGVERTSSWESKLDDDLCIIIYNEQVYWAPSRTWEIGLTIETGYRMSEKVSEDKLKPIIHELLEPAKAVASFLIAFVTQQMWMLPLVLPPLEEDDGKKKRRKKSEAKREASK
ncbi:MAG: hypothetical protein ACUVSP_09005 [Desulfotomaculales bacterium]